MELLKVLSGISLIFITLKVATSNSIAKVHQINEESISLTGYDICLTIYTNENDYKNTSIYERFKSYFDLQQIKGNFIFYGESTMIFYFINESNKIQVHIGNLKIKDIKVAFTYGGVNLIQSPKIQIYDDETIIFYVNRTFKPEPDFYRLIIKYVGSITDTGSFFKISYENYDGDKKWLIAAADFQGVGARQIFPCWDEPSFRSNFIISIKHPRHYRVLSNEPIFNKTTADDDMVWTNFSTTDKISPYHVAVVLSDLHHNTTLIVSDTVMWYRPHVERQLKFAQRVVQNVTWDLESIFLIEPPLPPKVDHIIIPGFRDEGLESWGLILYRESAVIYDENLDFVARKFEVALTVARKIVHQYFGNLISQSSWSYLWLNEGIATVLAMEIVGEVVPFLQPNLKDLFAVQFQQESLRLNDYYDMPLVSKIDTTSDINSLFSFTHYIKAPVFIRTLKEITHFSLGIANYIYTYQLESINTSVSTINLFLDELQCVHVANINFTKRFIPWTKQKRYPVLQVTREPSGNKVNITLLQKDRNESYPKDLWIHVNYITQSDSRIRNRWLSPHKPILHLTHVTINDWIIVNVKQAGEYKQIYHRYYRVNYDNDNWQKLVKYLNSTKYLNIHVLNRAQIIDDAYYFLTTGRLDFHFFKRLTYYLSNETDYIAWYPMFKILEQLSGFFPFQQSTKVKEHFQEILTSLFNNIERLEFEFSKVDDFTKCLKQEASKWACTLNSLKCKAVAVSSLIYWIFHTNPEPILPGWKEWTYCKGMMLANEVTWNEVWKSSKNKENNTIYQNNKIFEFLACSEKNIIRYIDLFILGYFYDTQHRIVVFYSIIARHARNNLVLDYILQNLLKIIDSYNEINPIAAIVYIINHLYSAEQLPKIAVYTTKFSDRLTLLKSFVNKKLEIRSHEIDRHINYFENFLKT